MSPASCPSVDARLAGDRQEHERGERREYHSQNQPHGWGPPEGPSDASYRDGKSNPAAEYDRQCDRVAHARLHHLSFRVARLRLIPPCRRSSLSCSSTSYAREAVGWVNQNSPSCSSVIIPPAPPASSPAGSSS